MKFVVKTVGDLKRALEDVSDDTLIVRLTSGVHFIIKNDVVFTFIPNYQTTPAGMFEVQLKNSRQFDGKNLLYVNGHESFEDIE